MKIPIVGYSHEHYNIKTYVNHLLYYYNLYLEKITVTENARQKH